MADVALPVLEPLRQAMTTYGKDRGLHGACMTLSMVLPYLRGDEDAPDLAARIWRGLREARGIEGLQIVDECLSVRAFAANYFSRKT